MKKSLILMLLFTTIVLPLSNVQAEDVFKPLIGSWLRPDGGYVLVIKDVQEDGKIDAAYLNPRNINVSKARAETKDGTINIFVELWDTGYPGSYYTLTYNKGSDKLIGVYHHLGINQNFDVFFIKK